MCTENKNWTNWLMLDFFRDHVFFFLFFSLLWCGKIDIFQLYERWIMFYHHCTQYIHTMALYSYTNEMRTWKFQFLLWLTFIPKFDQWIFGLKTECNERNMRSVGITLHRHINIIYVRMVFSTFIVLMVNGIGTGGRLYWLRHLFYSYN